MSADRIQNHYDSASVEMDNDEAFESIKSKLKETWSFLSDEDIALYDNERNKFFDKLEEKYGLDRDEAESRLEEIEDAYDPWDEEAA